MKIFISDFHIGSPLFKKKRELINLFNDPAVEEIFILGDVLDFWEGRVSKIIKRNSELINFINDCDKVTIIIKGNHDPSKNKLSEIFNKRIVLETHEMDLFGKTALLIHGDKFDGSIFWGRILYPIQFISERLGFNLKALVRNTAHRFLLWKNNLNYNSLVFDAEKSIVDAYCGKYNIVISGHTHMEKIIQLPDILFINTGSLVDKPSYVAIDKNTVTIKEL